MGHMYLFLYVVSIAKCIINVVVYYKYMTIQMDIIYGN